MSESAPVGEADSGKSGTSNNSTECPTCGGSYSSNRGMRMHHAKAHGESLSYETKECEYCGDTFRVLKCKDNTRFCSQPCLHKWRSENERGEDHPSYCQVKRDCEICGETVSRKPSHLEQQENVFCSYSCHREYQSRNQVGENHHNYTGGRAKEYGPNWHRKRREAIKRDHATCQRCGEYGHDFNRTIHVHHRTPRKKFISDGELDYKKANELSNLVCLCPSCHKTVERWPVRVEI